MVKSSNYFIRVLRHHPRLYISIGIGCLFSWLASNFGVNSKLTQALIGYDLGAIIYIILASYMMASSTAQQMRKRALNQDDGKVFTLLLIVAALIFTICAIATNLANVKNLHGSEKVEILSLAILTIVASWFFTNIVFALHYAHDYYFEVQNKKAGGLIFLPLDEEPNYFDFLYFSFIIGATAQTADVNLASKKMRRSCTLHCILAFFFNTTLLALTINIAAGIF